MDEIQGLLEELGAVSYQKSIDWKGYNVYVPIYKGKPCIGLPYVVLVKGEEVRLSTPDESLEYLEYEQSKKQYSYGNGTEILDAVNRET